MLPEMQVLTRSALMRSEIRGELCSSGELPRTATAGREDDSKIGAFPSFPASIRAPEDGGGRVKGNGMLNGVGDGRNWRHGAAAGVRVWSSVLLQVHGEEGNEDRR